MGSRSRRYRRSLRHHRRFLRSYCRSLRRSEAARGRCAETLALDVETSAFGAATSAIARRSFDAPILVLDAEMSAIMRSYRRYWRGVSGDCGVGITPQMCNSVTNRGDMSTFSKPGPSTLSFVYQ